MLKNHAGSCACSIALFASLLLSATASAATLYWDGTGSGWNSVSSWSTAFNATTPNPVAVPGSSDIAFFNISTVNSNQTVNLNIPQSASGLIFASTGTTLIQSGIGSTPLTLVGNGISIVSGAGADTISANVNLSAAQSWTNNSAIGNFTLSGNLALGANTLTYTGPGNAAVTGIISGTGGLTKSGSGTLTLQGSAANLYTGNTTVNDGTLALAMSNSAYAFNGNLIIGDGVGAPASAVVNMVQVRQLNFNSPPSVTLNTDGALALNDSDDVINNITMTGGSITKTANFFYNEGSFTTNANAASATVSGAKMFLYGFNTQVHTFTVADGAAQYDLDFSSGIDGAAYNNFMTKDGPGAMRISGNSTFSTLTLANGALYLTGNNTFTGPLNVNNNTSLFVANQSLGVVNFAPSAFAFLNVFSANATIGGLQTDAVNPGGANVTNPQFSPAILTIANNANNTYAGAITNGNAPLGITKAGTGTLTLTGYMTFTLPLTINAGTLVLSATNFTADVINNATFVYSAGPFPGRLTNAGTTILNIDLTAGNGFENDSTFNVNSGRTVTLNGLGLDNEGTLNMAGGTLFLSTDLTANNINRGTLNLYNALPLSLSGATLNNRGTLNLSTGLIIGATGLLTNGPGGTINGPGAITSPFSNSGGLIAVASGTLNITQPFANTGGILLSSNTATLSGGNITNPGFIRGTGNVGNNITNTGTIEPLGNAALLIGGSLTNSGAGILRAGTGNQLIVLPGLATNAGTISLTGGTFDNNNHPLNNTGQITGYGTFSTGGGGLTNNGAITLTGTNGNTTTVNGDVTNAAGKTISVKFNPAIFTGNITNNGTFNVTSTAASFGGGFSGNGTSSGGLEAAPLLSPSAGGINGSGDSTVDSAGAILASYIRQGSLSNAGQVQLRSRSSGGDLSALNALSITGAGQFDLNDNDLIVNYTGASPAVAIRAYLVSGFNSGNWNGVGLSSAAAHSDSFGTSHTALGYADVSSTTFDGQAIASAVIVKYTYYGDANLDGKVDGSDFQRLLDGLVAANAGSWSQGDFTYDGKVDLGNDFTLFLANYFNQGGVLGDLAPFVLSDTSLSISQRAQLLSFVPEPASFGLLGLAACLLRRRRR